MDVLEVDIIYGTAVNDSTIAAVHYPKSLFLLVICHCSYSASYQKSYLEAFLRTESKNIAVSSMKGKKHPCAVMNIHNDVGVCFSTVESDLFFKIIYKSLSFHLVHESASVEKMLLPSLTSGQPKVFQNLFCKPV